jgi:hypothetical protein
MAPNLRFAKVHESQDDLVPVEALLIKRPTIQNEQKTYEYKRQIVWRNVIIMGALHAAAVWSAYLMATKCMWQTNLFSKFSAL